MTESQGTAEEQIRAHIRLLEGKDATAVTELSWVLTLVHEENMERAKKLSELKTEVMKEMNVRTYDELVCAEPPESAAFVGKVVWVRKWQWELLLKRLDALEGESK